MPFYMVTYQETVYMIPPSGSSFGDPDLVCRLRRSLYGLKQGPHGWFENFHNTILLAKFQQIKYDPSMFIRHTSSGIIKLLVYVDDILISGDDSIGIQNIKNSINTSFHMKDLGHMT